MEMGEEGTDEVSNPVVRTRTHMRTNPYRGAKPWRVDERSLKTHPRSLLKPRLVSFLSAFR